MPQVVTRIPFKVCKTSTTAVSSTSALSKRHIPPPTVNHVFYMTRRSLPTQLASARTAACRGRAGAPRYNRTCKALSSIVTGRWRHRCRTISSKCSGRRIPVRDDNCRTYGRTNKQFASQLSGLTSFERFTPIACCRIDLLYGPIGVRPHGSTKWTWAM
jgi:hypothetical protein